MAGVGSKSREVACISESASVPGGDRCDVGFFSTSSCEETSEAVERVMASADKPKMGR
jgi:hypothetical protein